MKAFFSLIVVLNPAWYAVGADESPARIDNVLLITEASMDGSSATLILLISLTGVNPESDTNDLALDVALKDPQGRQTAQVEIEYLKRQGNHAIAEMSLPVQAPLLWNAETPHLYSLLLELRRGDKSLDTIVKKIGLRQITIRDGVLLLDARPIRLRGVCYDEFDPTMDDAVRLNLWKRDLDLMQRAHINAIRVPDGLPAPGFLALCDQMGLYVICNEPFSRDALVPDHPSISASYADYQNHPSVIVWSVGNTSHDADSIREITQMVKEKDPSRPLLSPGLAQRELPDPIDILAPSFPTLEQLRQISRRGRPVIICDHTDALESSFEGLADVWDSVRRNKTIAGGMIWRFADRNAVPNGEGLDGIVDADRAPQTDYWQTRRVYSPIRIEETERKIKAGRNIVELTLHNDYDFTNLRDVPCRWLLRQNKTAIDQGVIRFDLDPHKTMKMAVTLDIPDDLSDNEYTLLVQFHDAMQQSLYEQVVRLRPDHWEKSFIMRLRDRKRDPDWNVLANNEEIQIKHRDFVFRTETWSNAWFMMTNDRHVRLIVGGPYLRLGREPTSAERFHYQNGVESLLPQSMTLKKWIVDKRRVDQQKSNVEIETLLHARDADSSIVETNVPQKMYPAQIDLLISPFGFCDVRFTLLPQKREEYFLETGLSFLVSPALNHISWLGNGPYPTYPGKEMLSQRGIFRFSPVDRLIPGNRSGVDLVALTDDRGYGLGLMLINGNVAFEPTQEGMLVSVNSAVAGLGARYHRTRHPLLATRMSASERTTVFRLIPLIKGRYPTLFETIFFSH